MVWYTWWPWKGRMHAKEKWVGNCFFCQCDSGVNRAFDLERVQQFDTVDYQMGATHGGASQSVFKDLYLSPHSQNLLQGSASPLTKCSHILWFNLLSSDTLHQWKGAHMSTQAIILFLSFIILHLLLLNLLNVTASQTFIVDGSQPFFCALHKQEGLSLKWWCVAWVWPVG